MSGDSLIVHFDLLKFTSCSLYGIVNSLKEVSSIDI